MIIGPINSVMIVKNPSRDYSWRHPRATFLETPRVYTWRRCKIGPLDGIVKQRWDCNCPKRRLLKDRKEYMRCRSWRFDLLRIWKDTVTDIDKSRWQSPENTENALDEATHLQSVIPRKRAWKEYHHKDLIVTATHSRPMHRHKAADDKRHCHRGDRGLLLSLTFAFKDEFLTLVSLFHVDGRWRNKVDNTIGEKTKCTTREMKRWHAQ